MDALSCTIQKIPILLQRLLISYLALSPSGALPYIRRLTENITLFNTIVVHSIYENEAYSRVESLNFAGINWRNASLNVYPFR